MNAEQIYNYEESLESLESQLNEGNVINKKVDGALDIASNDNTNKFVRIQPEVDNKMLQKTVLSNVKAIDFASYIDTMGGNHKKYLKNTVLHIPNKVVAVVVCDYMHKIISPLGYSISKLHSNDVELEVAYLFNRKCWQQINVSYIQKLLRSILIKGEYDPVESQTSGLSNLLRDTFWTNAPNTPIKDSSRILINLDNGTLEILPNGSIKLLPFNKDDFMLYCLPYVYESNASCSQFINYLNRVLPDKESQMVLQELLGSIFIKHIKLEKIGILLGSGANGKSVLLNIVTALLGSNNISQMDLKSLTTDRNADNNRAHLMGKLLNFAPEINAKGEQSHDLIKRMASGEAIQVKMLYKDTITITDYAKFIFNANSLPSDVEHTYGYFRRFLIVDFNQTISKEEADLELANKIIASELSGVLNWVIEGTQRLQKNKAFSACKRSEDILERYKLESDVVAMWLSENGYIRHDSLTTPLKDLYSDFKQYAIESGYKIIADKTLSSRLRVLGYKVEKPKGYSTRVYITKQKL